MAKRFHHKTGTMVTLTNGEKTACRNNPHQEFNNGLVMSSEPLLDDQLFEVRIDKQVPTWSGSIEIGVTNLNPSSLDFPPSATNLREGSWVMSGTSILEDGKSQLEEYGHDLDELSEGDTVGVMRTSNGDLHFFVNGIDQGVSAQQVTGTIYAVVDLYGKCAQVSIVEPDAKKSEFICPSDRLHFHELCGSMVKLSNSKRTAERKKPVDEFNNGVVMTHRPLRDDELFEIRIDELVNKWSGSIEMGITEHNPEYLDFPATMTNMRTGTIMMSGCGILTNGKGSRREYGEYNLDELHEGDRIGLVKKSNKNLHYYINGLDQGIAAENVPDVVFGVVDLYGMTVKVSITDHFRPTVNEPDSEISMSSVELRNLSINQPCPRIGLRYDDLLFHGCCGLHVTVINNGRTAFRPNCLNDFNNAVVITNRPLKPGEIFEVLLEQVVMKWAGTIEIGVTMHSAEELNFPSTMTNVRSGTWMMTGNGIMYNGTIISDEYGCSLDKLKAGDKIGVVVYEDETLHFFINGIDQGLAATNVPIGVYGVIDLYGQAAKASIVHASESPTYYEEVNPQRTSEFVENLPVNQCTLPSINRKAPQVKKSEVDQGNDISRPRAASYDPHLLYFDDGDESLEEYSNDDIIEPPRSFHPIHGVNVSLDPIGIIATRKSDYHHGVVFSSKNLERDDLYEVQIYTINDQWSGVLRYGVTTYEPENQMMLPPNALGFLGCDTWLIADSHFYKNGHIIKRNYAVYFPRVTAGDKIGVKIFNDDSLHFFINGADLGIAAVNMPKKLRVVADIYGAVESIMIHLNPNTPVINPDTKNSEKKCEAVTPIPAEECTVMAFHENHGRNIQLSNENLTASRIASYNQGVVISCKALQSEELFQIQVDNLHSEWSGSLQIGITSQSPDQACLPISALSIRKGTWIISGDCVFYNGIKVKSKYGPNLETLKSKHKIGIQLDQDRNLHLFVNGIDQGIAAEDIPHPAYAIVDVYGQCKQVTINLEAYSSEDEIEKDDKEKADIEYIGEKIVKPVCSSQLLPRNCDHQKICSIIKSVLGLLESYFLPENIICFCETCHKLRNDEPYFKKGDPPREYAQPFGWCRFPLRSATKAEKSGFHEKWHVAFHGTEFGSVRRMLEHGRILPPNLLGFKIQHRVSDRGEKSKETEDSLILISPTMRYAGSSKFSPVEEFVDSSSKKLYQAKVAFQVYVRPGSYTIGPQQLGVRDPIDTRFSNNDLEWYTKEENSIILHSLLMKVDPV